MKYSLLGTLFLILFSWIGGSFTGLCEAQKEPPLPLSHKQISVVCSFSILADLVQEIGGDQIHVVALVGPNSDAHVFTPTTHTNEQVTQADLVVFNGLGFEGWMTRLIESCGFKGPVILASEGLHPLWIPETDLSQGPPTSKKQGSPDPHAWHDVQNVHIYVQNIARALSRIDPGHEALYETRLKAYEKKLDHLDAWIRKQFAFVALKKRKVITTHDAFGYFGRAYGLDFLAPLGVSTEAEPSAKSIAELISLIRQENIPVVFIENMTNPTLIERIADETGASVAGPVYSDALSEPGGPADTYFRMMVYNTRLFAHSFSRRAKEKGEVIANGSKAVK